MKKLFTTILVLAFITTSALHAQATVQVGTGEIASRSLINQTQYNTFTQTIYPAEILPSRMNITEIAYEYVGRADVPKKIKIWMSTTTSQQINSNGAWVSAETNKKVVFEGEINRIPPTGAAESTWLTIVLDSSYLYNGSNLVITTSAYDLGWNAYTPFRASPSPNGRLLTTSAALTNPLGGDKPVETPPQNPVPRQSSADFLNVRFTFTPETPVITVTPNPVKFPDTRVTTSNTRTVTVSNTGTGTLNVSGVNVSNPTFTHNATFPIALNAGQSRDITFSFSPTVENTYSATAQFTISGTGHLGNNTINLSGRAFDIMPHTVGTGTDFAAHIIWQGSHRTFAQTIYPADLLPIAMKITQFDYEYVGPDDRPINIKVWFSTTTENHIQGRWVTEETDRQLVFDGQLLRAPGFPSRWLPIVLDVPYNYTGGNLVVTTSAVMNNSHPQHTQFRITPSTGARHVTATYRDNMSTVVHLDHETIPTNPTSNFSTFANFTNIKFYYKNLDGRVLTITPGALDFPEQLNDAARTKPVTIANIGNQPMTIADINITEPPGNNVFSHNATFPIVLNAGGSREITFAFEPEFIGRYSATAEFIVAEDEFLGSNILPITGAARDFVPLEESCFAQLFEGTTQLIGSTVPHSNSRYIAGQFIVTRNAIQTDTEGRIRRIGFETVNQYLVDNVTAIYLKNTNMVDYPLAARDQAFTNASEMTKVYEGPIIFDAGGWTYIDITPFVWDGTSNLLVGVYQLETAAAGPSNNINVSIKHTDNSRRATIQLTSMSQPIDPYDPPSMMQPGTGGIYTSFSGNFIPNICLVLDEIPQEANIFVNTRRFDFDEQEMATIATLPITITNMGIADLVITGVNFTSADFFVHNATFPIVVPFGKDTILNFGVTPLQLGFKTGRGMFEFATPTVGNPWVEFSVEGLRFNALREGFEGDVFPPIGWKIIDANNDGLTWTKYVRQDGVQWVFMSQPRDGRAVVAGHHAAQNIMEASLDDWLITPKMRHAEGDKFSFYAARGAGLTHQDLERVYVYLSRTGNNIADFNQTIDRIDPQGVAWRRFEYDLSEFDLKEGDEYYIAFHDRSFGVGSKTQLDRFRGSMVVLPNHDLMAHNFGMTDGIFKVNEPRTYTASVSNAGLSTVNGSDFTVELCHINHLFQTVVLASKPGQTIERASVYTVSFDHAFAQPGKYNMFVRIVYAQDENSANNASNVAVSDILSETTVFIRSGTIEPGFYPTKAFLPVFFNMQGLMGSLAQMYYPQAHFQGHAGVIDRFRLYIEHAEARPNRNVRIWMQNSTLDSIGGETILPNANEMELVYNGRLTFPQANMPYEVFEITLHTPFTYTGENLIIMMEYHGGQGADNGPFFFSVVNNNQRRTRFRLLGPGDADNVNASNLVTQNETPVTSFFMDKGTGYGTLSGQVVYDASMQPAADARVSVTSATFPKMNAVIRTKADGNFHFPKIFAVNDLKITVSKHGFLDAVVENIELNVDGTITVPPIQLLPRPRVAVTGRVLTSDRQEPLPNATVKLFGMEDFTVTTGADGVFTFDNVWNNHTYRLEIEHGEYQKFISTAQVENANPTSLGDFTVLQIAHRVNALTATQLANQTVELKWVAPLAEFEKVFRYDDGNVVNVLTLENPNPSSVVGPLFLENGIIRKVMWYQQLFSDVVVTDTIDIVIFGLHPNGTPNHENIIGRFRNIGTRPNQWNEYVLPTPVVAENGFMIGLAGANRQLMAFMYDNGNHPDWPWRPNTMWSIFNFEGGQLQIAPIEALITFRQNLLIRAEGTWTGDFVPIGKAPSVVASIDPATGNPKRLRTLTVPSPNPVEGYLTEMPQEQIRMTETVLRTGHFPASEWLAENQRLINEIAGARACPDRREGSDVRTKFDTEFGTDYKSAPAAKSTTPLPPIGFNVYRANVSTSIGADQGVYIRQNTGGPVTGTSWIDSEYPSIGRGQYRYAVRALYVGGIESDLALSNVLDKDVFLTAGSTIRVTHNATGHPLSLISGSSLKLVNNATRQEYTGTVGATGIISLGTVYRGIYTLTIESIGFETYVNRTLDFTTSDTAYTIDVELIEEIINPHSLSVRSDGQSVTIGAIADFSWNPVSFFDGAEDHENFAIDNVDNWIFYTPHDYEVSYLLNVTYPNRGEPQAWTIWNPMATTPPTPSIGGGIDLNPYRGNKYFLSWNSFGNTVTTDCWMISKELDFEAPFDFSFYVGGARGYKEEYQVLYSTGSTETRHFRSIGGTRITNGPWGLVSVKMPAEAKRVAIRHFYDYNLGLKVDNISIGIPPQETRTFKHYEVYLDDRFVGQTTDVDFQFTELRNGIRTAGVVAVYSSGKSEMSTIEFEVTNGLENKFYVDVLEMENGSIVVKNPSGNEIPEGTLIDGGTTITITAVPEYGYRPLLVTVDGTPFVSGQSIAITKDLLVTATFEVRTYSITFDPNGGTGTMAPQGFTYGIPQNLTANAFTPPTDMYFIGWAYTATGDIVYSNQAEYFATDNKTLFAIWDDNPVVVCTITLSANPTIGGTVSGGGNHNQGLLATVRATANTGYRFVNWTEGTTEVSTEANYTFTVTEDRTLVANFVQFFRVNITQPANGTVSVKVSGVDVNHGDELDHGTVLTLLATPDENYEFVRWTHDNHTGSTHSHTLTNHITISAVFRLKSSIQTTEKEILTIYPNPVKDELNIQTEQVIKNIVVFDLSGKIMMNLQGNHRTINMQTIPIGNYIIRIHTENAIIPVRIVKQ